MLPCNKNFRDVSSKSLEHRLSLTETAIEMFLENGCTFYDRQITLLHIVLSRCYKAQNVQAVHQRDFRKARQVKQIK